ncbi:MAG: sigma-54 dependent transcriptional regulator [Gemmatimonadota bacterium]|nr:sigma-54 dependent transcriptional regulator [Gemmatimonadota bacterium]
MARVLIDERDMEAAVLVRRAAGADGHETILVGGADEADLHLGGDEPVALVLTGSPDAPATRRLLSTADGHVPRPPVLAVCEAQIARDLRGGERAEEFDDIVGLPASLEEIQVSLAQQLERYELQVVTGIIGRTEGIREALGRVRMFAPVGTTVLITGESGTGKELAARGIHRLSPRRSRPFIAVNCAAMPETLLESELFGHEKGAFTGATSRRRGMFELADGGTLFLDEIGEMPIPLQTRLLRVLEARRFMRVGGDVEIEVDVRVIAATNRDLREAVRDGTFRRDLYYRLHVLHMEMPPLRERPSDIHILVRGFIEEFTRRHDREFRGLSSDAMQILLDYAWPGNVRELRNLIESMVVLAPGKVIRPADIPAEIRTSSGRTLLPVRAGGAAADRPAGGDAEDGGLPALRLPEMEFLFRTLVEMKIDLEDLRTEFERFRRRHAVRDGNDEDGEDVAAGRELAGRELRAIEIASSDWPESLSGRTGEPDADDGAETAPPSIELAPGMTMHDIEREAIVIALREVGGNRRRAAERLGIGERTLYRKLKEYGIDG